MVDSGVRIMIVPRGCLRGMLFWLSLARYSRLNGVVRGCSGVLSWRQFASQLCRLGGEEVYPCDPRTHAARMCDLPEGDESCVSSAMMCRAPDASALSFVGADTLSLGSSWCLCSVWHSSPHRHSLSNCRFKIATVVFPSGFLAGSVL